MSDGVKQIKEAFMSHFEMSKKTLMACGDNQLLLSFIGNLDQSASDLYTEKLENILEEEGLSTSIRKRFFGVFLEGIQNASIHGYRIVPEENLTSFVVYKSPDNYTLLLGNFVDKQIVSQFESNLEKINALNSVELKKYYLERMSDGKMSEKGGAGLGIITMALKSKNPLKYKFVALNEELSFYELQISVNF